MTCVRREGLVQAWLVQARGGQGLHQACGDGANGTGAWTLLAQTNAKGKLQLSRRQAEQVTSRRQAVHCHVAAGEMARAGQGSWQGRWQRRLQERWCLDTAC